MDETVQFQINPNVAGVTIGSKHQVADSSRCLIRQNLQDPVFASGDKCLQCGVHASPKRYGEVHVPTDPEFSCRNLNPIPEEELNGKGVKVIWEKGYPNIGCVEF